MSLLVANCPRCGATEMTFDVRAQVFRGTLKGDPRGRGNWQDRYEVFAVCRNGDRKKPTIFVLTLTDFESRERYARKDALVDARSSLNNAFSVDKYISIRDHVKQRPPEHLPPEIKKAFEEGAACYAIACYNAAANV